MSNNLLFLSLGPLSVLVFLLLEYWRNTAKGNKTKAEKIKRQTKSKEQFFKRLTVYLFIALTGLAVSLLSSHNLLMPLVAVFSPLEIISISSIAIPLYFNMALSFLSIDLCQYWVHRLHHKIPFLWRLHRLHHSDKNVDSLTTFLHHPIEILSTFVVSITLYILFDIPMIILLAYSIVFSLHAAFTHTSLTINPRLEKYLGYVIVTPSIHRLHHALDFRESNSNFGQIFSFWDRLFGSYIKPAPTKKALIFGISKDQSPSSLSLKNFLANPIRKN